MTTNITNIGIMMSCFDEVEAVSFAIQELRKFYPENKIYHNNWLMENFGHTESSIISDIIYDKMLN